ncbi:hypothetical protein R1sor_001913 [Riccia sorocarpa]|uniref:Reverse transcriptase domain-containing protein n=1 Tax=Riccia sorocarpa TaxID=122646 RepID=A0ABD3H1H0_9MARC
MLHVFAETYTNIYAQTTYTDTTLPDLLKTLETVQPQVTEAQKQLLSQLPPTNEISDVVSELPPDKAHGLDAFSAEAVKLIWSFFQYQFFQFVNLVWRTGIIPTAFLKGAIRLLPKGETQWKVGDWRPVTLLSFHYKVIARILASRLAVILPHLVPPQQAGFVKGRSTIDSVLLLLLIHDKLKREKVAGAFLKLDFSKAYDRLSHEYLWLLLERFGFGQGFIKLVKSLTIGATSAIYMEGLISPDILLLSASRINLEKSQLIQIGADQQPPEWVYQLRYQVIPRDQPIKYLGYWFASSASDTQLWSITLSSIKKRIAAWDDKVLSFEGRVILMNHILAAIPIYTLAVAKLKVAHFDQLRQILVSFVWAEKTHLVAWKLVQRNKELGGLGIRDFRHLQVAIFAKLVLRAITQDEKADWMWVFFSICKVQEVDQLAERLLLRKSVHTPRSSLANKLLKAWNKVQPQLRLTPTVEAFPSHISLRTALKLWCKSDQANYLYRLLTSAGIRYDWLEMVGRDSVTGTFAGSVVRFLSNFHRYSAGIGVLSEKMALHSRTYCLGCMVEIHFIYLVCIEGQDLVVEVYVTSILYREQISSYKISDYTMLVLSCRSGRPPTSRILLRTVDRDVEQSDGDAATAG